MEGRERPFCPSILVKIMKKIVETGEISPENPPKVVDSGAENQPEKPVSEAPPAESGFKKCLILVAHAIEGRQFRAGTVVELALDVAASMILQGIADDTPANVAYHEASS